MLALGINLGAWLFLCCKIWQLHPNVGWDHVGWCRGQREVAWLGAKESFLVIFYPKIGIFLSSPETIDVFNQDFIS